MSINDIRPCPACESGDRQLKGEKNGFDIHGCSRCGSFYTDKLPAAEEFEDYEQHYSGIYLDVPDYITDRVREIVKSFGPYEKLNRLLDIGFGAGTILDVAKEMGWKTFGVEVSKSACEHASGHQTFHGSLRDAKYPDNYFDVITASEILEHVTSPQDELKEINRILRPGGLFWGTTPSSSGISGRVLGVEWPVMKPPDHTQLFSKKAMSSMLKEAGFTKFRLLTHGTDPYRIVNHLRKRKPAGEFNPAVNGYTLNESLSKSPVRKMVKQTLNASLNLFGLGDSLKIYATKSTDRR